MAGGGMRERDKAVAEGVGLNLRLSPTEVHKPLD